jgi:hypothetical protein
MFGFNDRQFVICRLRSTVCNCCVTRQICTSLTRFTTAHGIDHSRVPYQTANAACTGFSLCPTIHQLRQPPLALCPSSKLCSPPNALLRTTINLMAWACTPALPHVDVHSSIKPPFQIYNLLRPTFSAKHRISTPSACRLGQCLPADAQDSA